MVDTKVVTVDDKLQHVLEYMDSVMQYGMRGMAGAVWPVIIRRWGDGDLSHKYPETYFQKLKRENRLDLQVASKADRVKILKALVDKLISEEITIHLYHLGLYLVYPYLGTYQREQDAELVGKKRKQYMETFSKFELVSNDEFIGTIWSDLIERYYPEIGQEVVRLPRLNEIRMLFTPNEFGNLSGMYYSEGDWLEPVPGRHIEVKKWTAEKDPMTQEPQKKNMIEGYITLGHQGSGNLRHFVNGTPIHAGSYIEVKFGDGWIPGRYEWSFNQNDPITIHSSRHEHFSIREGHLVRIKE